MLGLAHMLDFQERSLVNVAEWALEEPKPSPAEWREPNFLPRVAQTEGVA